MKLKIHACFCREKFLFCYIKPKGKIMPLFYRGAGVGTYWHQNDARVTGFTAQAPGMVPSVDRLMQHVKIGTINSPYVSLTRSFGVAWTYAVFSGRNQTIATQTTPGYVYELEINEPLLSGLQFIDPVKEIAAAAPAPLAPISYQHDGLPEFLLGVVEPNKYGHFLTVPCLQPPPGGGTPRSPNLTIQLETLVRVLRDAEVLAVGSILASLVRNRFEVWLQ